MNYKNPWSDCSNFIDLGEFEYNSQPVDLYVLKHESSSLCPSYFSMGCRLSNEPSDYFGIPLYENNVEVFENKHHYQYVREIIKRLKDRGLMKEWGFEPPIPSA